MNTKTVRIDGKERQIIENPWAHAREVLTTEDNPQPTVGQMLDLLISLDARSFSMFTLKQTFIEGYGHTNAVILKDEEDS